MKPNFLVIGAAKAGTTLLYYTLKQHPQIYMVSVKEPNFFALQEKDLNSIKGIANSRYLAQCITTKEQYEKQFEAVTDEVAIGEVSPIYLYNPKAPTRIKNYIPEIKLVAILRNPVERAYANFLHHIREGLETVEDFSEALDQEEYRIKNNWWWGFHYVKAGFYSEQLIRYYNQFSPHQIKVYLYEDLKENPQQLFQDLFNFLGVDSKFQPDLSEQYNVSGIPKNRLWHQLLSKPSTWKAPFKILVPFKLRQNLRRKSQNQNLVKPEMPPVLAQHLKEVYSEEIMTLQKLLKRDLSHWLN